MSGSDPDAAKRNEAMLDMASAVRDLVAATVRTARGPGVLNVVAAQVREATDLLSRETHPGHFSGLQAEVDLREPHSYLPLTPMAGLYNPIAPPLNLWVKGSRTFGSVRLGRAHTGPPGRAHGGSSASLCDQILGVAAWSVGFQGFTTEIWVRFLRPVPLDVDLQLEAWVATRDATTAHAEAVIRRDGTDLVTASGELVLAESLIRKPDRAV
ncbi:MAG: PaaI family thioesterase [Mycobacterium sp.]|uniref:PaaI family thioesterase n=1 Tax=Mycobacterium sp. TaxID=1785 RepID=UPI003C32ED44